ncbi:MAG: hypothetical protein WBA57_12260 [Elainellaceae cyanobacterium]
MNNNFNIQSLNANNAAVNMGGTIHGDQIGIQHNIAHDPQFTKAIAELSPIIEKLQRQQPATDAEANAILEAEFTELQRTQPDKLALLQRQLLNRDRWFNGGKAALTELTKTLADKLLLNVFIAFLEGYSEDVE